MIRLLGFWKFIIGASSHSFIMFNNALPPTFTIDEKFDLKAHRKLG